MACDEARQFLLDTGWDAAGRRSAAQFLRHAESCDACRAALKDYDVLREMMSPPVEVPEPAGGWEALAHRLQPSMARGRHPHLGTTLKIAAMVLIAVAIFQTGRYATPPAKVAFIGDPSTRRGVAASSATIPPQEVARSVDEFRKVSKKAFDGQASWMLVSQNDSDVGVASTPLPPKKKVLLLRLLLRRGNQSVSQSDLVVIAGQKADLTLPLSSGQSLHYRIGTSTEEPTPLTLWLELNTPKGKEPLAALATTLQLHPDQSVTAGKLTTSAGEYELRVEFASRELSDEPSSIHNNE